MEGDVEVFADLRLGGHHLDHLLGEGGRVGVVEANPLQLFDATQPTQQLAKHTLAVEVDAVVGGVLSDDNQLLDPLVSQLACLLFQLLHPHRAVLATDERNGTVAALPVAPLRDFQVGVVVRGRQVAFGGKLLALHSPQTADDVVPGAGAEVTVHFGNLLTQLVGITLREAAHHKELLDAPRTLRLDRLQNQFNRLGLRIANEAAGVDNHHLGICSVAVEAHLVAGGGEAGHQVLRIDRVFGASEGDDVNFFHCQTGR